MNNRAEEIKTFAVIRKDILAEGLGVPVGENDFYYSPDPIEYRWINEDTKEEQFQVFFNGEWKEAYSIDFDFPNPEPTQEGLTALPEQVSKLEGDTEGGIFVSLPAPWRIGKFDSVVVTDERNKSHYQVSDNERGYYGGYLVAESIFPKEHALLIAAAPELLKALQFCQSVIASQGMFDLSERMAYDKATEAINKATGKQ